MWSSIPILLLNCCILPNKHALTSFLLFLSLPHLFNHQMRMISKSWGVVFNISVILNILCSLGRHQVCILSGSGWLHPLLSIPIVTVIWVLSSQLERIYPMSSKQKLNTTTAELVGINDAMAMILWVYHFLETQGYNISHNVIFQDNESTMQLAKMDSILVANRPITLTFAIILLLMSYIGVRHRLHTVQLANFFTKGSLFRIFRKKILNVADVGKNIGQQYCWCSLMWLMPLKSLSNCDYELNFYLRLILGPIHSNQVIGTDPVGSHHGTRNSRSNSVNPTYRYQSHD